MRIYHGGNVKAEKPALIVRNRFLDLCLGFYTTTDKAHAENYAEKIVVRCGGNAIVNIYEVDDSVFSDLTVKRFTEADEEWLDFVAENRNGLYKGKKYDLIIGAVADDDVYQSLQLYLTGLYTKEQTLADLKVKKLYNQYVFATEKALGYLKFTGREEVQK